MAAKRVSLLMSLLVLGLVLAGVADADLVGWWRLDGNALDSSGNSHDGVLYGGPEWVQGIVGGALKFDGVDDRLEMPGTSQAAGFPATSGGVTWAMWIKASPGTGSQTILCQGPVGAAHIQGNRSINVEASGAIMVRAHSVGALTSLYSAATVDDNQWHHIAATFAFETAGSNDTMKVYIDGDLSKGYVVDNVNINQYAAAAADFVVTLGYRGGNAFSGAVDDVRIYDQVLSDAEVQDLFQNPGAPVPLAYGPKPRDGSMLAATATTLAWVPGDFAASHRVYFGTSFDDVNAATPDSAGVFLGSTTESTAPVGQPETLVPGTTYYWRVDEVNDAQPESPWKGNVWSFWVRPDVAWSPAPADGLNYVHPDQDLNWQSGLGNLFHTIYLGDDFDTVSNATAGGVMQVAASYDPGPLQAGKTYFWRVDEFDGFKTHKGAVWSFTTVPNVPVGDAHLLLRWALDEGQGATAVDWSGHGNHGMVTGDARWIDGYAGGALQFDGVNDSVRRTLPADADLVAYTVTAWVRADRVGQAQYASVFNNNSNSSDFQIDVDGTNPGYYRYIGIGGNGLIGPVLMNWVHLAVTCEGNTTSLYYNGEPAGTVTTADTLFGQFALAVNRGGTTFFTGAIDDARVYGRALSAKEIVQVMRIDPLLAWDPAPARYAMVDIRDAKSLSWLAGDTAASQDVYLGHDRAAVATATEDSPEYQGNRTATTLSLAGLVEFGGGDYCWRIDEVESDGTVHPGDVWKFTVPDYLIVDDFESYTDDMDSKATLFDTWIDGLTNGLTGSVVGNAQAPFAERQIVNGGAQAMPLTYDNLMSPYYSEAERTWATPQNWMLNDVDTLTLYIRGDAQNDPDRLYVALEDRTGKVAVAVHPVANIATTGKWTRWDVPLGRFAGVDTTNVKKMYIGLGDRAKPTAGGTGKIYIDDIRVTRSAP